MKTKQLIEKLEYYNEWRRGAEVPQPDPKEVGECIDEVVEMLKDKDGNCPHCGSDDLAIIDNRYCCSCDQYFSTEK